ncbi:hypothetical protein HG531_013965 [Fusarium graminearum]|nr:hypothetical protein HG531_013965 [Fusarium graminearum]
MVIPAPLFGACLKYSTLCIAGSLCSGPLTKLGTHILVQKRVEDQLSNFALSRTPFVAFRHKDFEEKLHAIVLEEVCSDDVALHETVDGPDLGLRRGS